jgi:hypothetical protein
MRKTMIPMIAALPLAMVSASPVSAQTAATSACFDRLVPYTARAALQSPEYSLDISVAGGGRLVYIGAAHSSDPAHPQFTRIEADWARVQPTVAFYEGPARAEAATADETIRQFGESGFVRFLAKRDGTRIERLEPDPRAEAAFVLQRFPPDQVKLFYVLREVARLRERRGLGEPELRTAAEQLLRQTATIFPELAAVVGSVDELEAAYRGYWSEPAEWWMAPQRWFNPGDSSAETGGIFTNDINAASSEFRNRHMAAVILREVRAGERVLAVVGADHVPAQAPVLRCALE